VNKQSNDENMESSGLFLGSEPVRNVRYRSAAQDDDKTDKVGDTGDDDTTDSDRSDADGTDKGDSDSRDTDGKD
jgi:hypothetical protein